MRRISHSAIKRFENCQASYIYYMILARINNSDANRVAGFGSEFHKWAESNFTREQLEEILLDNEDFKKDLEDMKLIIEQRDYYKYPAVNEMMLETAIGDLGIVWGYADRIVFDIDRKKIIIVDYKTANEPNPQRDISQLFTYCYTIYENESVRNKILEQLVADYPFHAEVLTDMCNSCTIDNFELILDYVRANYPHRVEVTLASYRKHAMYLFNTFRRIAALEEEYNHHKSIKKLNHTDGNCTFCFMKGICMAYHMVINCYYDTEFYDDVRKGWEYIQGLPVDNGCVSISTDDFDEGTPLHIIERHFCEHHNIMLDAMRKGEIVLNTMGLISEFMERNRQLKNNTERVAALKRSLMSRYDAGDELVKQYFAKQQNNQTYYPTEKILEEILPKILKSSVKDVKFKDMIDLKKAAGNLIPLLVNLIGNNLNKSAVPDDMQKAADKYKTRVPSKAYLKTR